MEPEPSSTPEPTDMTASNSKKERNFPTLDLKDQSTLSTDTQPVLVVQSPKTPTLSRKLKAVSLDSEPQQQTNTLEVSRDVFSMPNTPKKQIKQKLSCDFDDGPPKCTLAPSFSSNLKKFASNNSISGSQTLKTLPEINALQDFSDCPNPEPQKFRTKGLLERRGSNASLTIDLGSTQSIAEVKPPVPLGRLNTAKSVSNLYLSSMSGVEKCVCVKKTGDISKTNSERRKSQETCGNCTIYESELKLNMCKARCQNLKRCHYCAKSRRKSLSNENLYVPPCGFCEGEHKECPELRNGKGNNRKAVFPRQQDLNSQLLSDDFKLHLQNMQYLQTAGKTLSVDDLKQSCEKGRIPKLQQEFWEVPLNLQEKCYVSGSQSKNRYRGLLPNEQSRVPLPSSGGYIHANYIKGPDYTETAYIATQGPLSHTCTDFWEMIWHSQCKCIVMLTGLVEKGRYKCELYFPLGKKTDTKEKTFFYVKTPKARDKFTFDSGPNANNNDEIYEFEEKNEVTFGKYRISYLNQKDLDECQIRLLELKNTDLDVEPRRLYHYWLSSWPDHKKTNAEQVLKMAVDVLNCLDPTKSDISESLSTCTNPRESMEVQKFDLRDAGNANLEFRVPTASQDVNEFCSISNISCRKDSGNKKSFNFDVTSSDNCAESTVTHSDALLQVTESHIETLTSRTITFSINSSSDLSQTFTSDISKGETKSQSSKFSFSESDTSQTKFDCQETRSRINESKSTPEACSSSQIRHKELEASTSSRVGSISEFNKETLTNRCSLDSKLKNLNKVTELKSHFKRELCMGPLKTKPSGSERKKSSEHITLPIIVHCSAGIGRTGCFLAILNGIQQLRLNNNVDILAILCSLRLNRGGMVQTAEQYELIHRVLSLYSDGM